ncbi:MAG: POTRA domain-containing protein [Terracidiphilus sp.]
MRRHVILLLAAIAVSAAVRPALSQKFLPKSIQFQGDPEYSNAELLAAAQLKPGVVLGYTDMQDCSKRLLDSGVFATVAFKYDGQDLIFMLTPSTDLYPVQLENLPLTPGKELDRKIHDQVPLYHGKVPSEAGLTEDVRAVLEKILGTQNLKATVTAVASPPQGPGQEGFVSYSISSPPVVVGEIRLAANSAPLDPGAQDILTKLTGSPYSVEGSVNQISTYLGNYYRDKGYVEAAIEAKPAGAAVAAVDAIQIPFEVSASPGLQYRLGAVELPPDSPIAQADFDRKAPIHPGDIAEGQRLTSTWQMVSRLYHNRGLMRASIHPVPNFDRFKATVSYTINVDPGPVYTMGKLSIENVSDDLRTAMLAAWKMPAGSTFNESAIMNFFAIGDANPALARVFSSASCRYTLTLNDGDRTVDVVLHLERKH